MFDFDQERLSKILGKGKYKPAQKYVCFLPFSGEFGWYLMNFVKRVQGYDHANKIVCIKPGHECLFPTASNFFYNWSDVPDRVKAGIIPTEQEERIKNEIGSMFGTDDICFLSPSETSWEEKMSLHENTFVPKSYHNFGLNVDVVITPRKRKIDSHRNWSCENWQYVINQLAKQRITVGVCGTPSTSCILDNVLYKSYDYIDVDSDVELMNNAKLVVSQESGLAYLSYMCKKPTMIIDHYHKDFGSDLHRDLNVPFKEVKYVWDNPNLLVDEILFFMNTTKWIKNDSSL